MSNSIREQQLPLESSGTLVYCRKRPTKSFRNCMECLPFGMPLPLTILLLLLLCFSVANSREVPCGDPPPVANEELKADITTKVKLLLRFIGDASLSGSIEKARKEIFSKYPDALMAYSNAFFLYQFCIVLMSDTKLSTKEKIGELTKFQREFGERRYYKVSPTRIKESASDPKTRKEIRDEIEVQNYQNAAELLFSDYYNMAKLDREKKDYSRAIEKYQQAIKINPDHYGTYYNLADSYRKLGQSEQALRAFEKALEISPNDARTHYNLANLYQQEGETNKAKEYYKKVIELETEGSDLSNRARKNLNILDK
jgi:tetratricopeptide (TPR) repeat protein